jgi:hypothetical protein
MTSTHCDFFQGQKVRDLFHWPNHFGETRLSKEEEEEEGVSGGGEEGRRGESLNLSLHQNLHKRSEVIKGI